MFFSASGNSGISPLGFWRETGVVASQSNNGINVYNTSSSANFRLIMPFTGQVVAFHWAVDTAITAGQMDLELFVNNAEITQTTLTSASGVAAAVSYSSPIGFTAGQTIEYKYTTDAGFLGATTIQITAFGRFV